MTAQPSRSPSRRAYQVLVIFTITQTTKQANRRPSPALWLGLAILPFGLLWTGALRKKALLLTLLGLPGLWLALLLLGCGGNPSSGTSTTTSTTTVQSFAATSQTSMTIRLNVR